MSLPSTNLSPGSSSPAIPTQSQMSSPEPKSLLSLPSELLLHTINLLTPLSRRPLTKDQYIERSECFKVPSDEGRQDLWNLAVTCRKMRAVTVERRFRVIRKAVGTMEEIWPEDLRWIAPHIEYFDLYESRIADAGGQSVFEDYDAVMSQVLPRLTNLLGLRVPGIPQPWCLSLAGKRLDYLEIAVDPSGWYAMPRVTAVANFTVGELVITQTYHDVYPSLSGTDEADEAAVGEGGVGQSGRLSRMKSLLSTISTVDHLMIRRGEIDSPVHLAFSPLELLGPSSDHIYARLSTLTVETYMGGPSGGSIMSRNELLGGLPSLLNALCPWLTKVDIIWHGVGIFPRDELEGTARSLIDSGISLESYLTNYVELQRTGSFGSWIDPLSTFHQIAKSHLKLETLRMEYWVASRQVDSSHTGAVKLLGRKPFAARTIRRLPDSSVKVEEDEFADEYGWMAVQVEQMKDILGEQ